jgi:hypothetical protein
LEQFYTNLRRFGTDHGTHVGMSRATAVVLGVLLAERGACARGPPAGHGWPAEWARMKVARLVATLLVLAQRRSEKPMPSPVRLARRC